MNRNILRSTVACLLLTIVAGLQAQTTKPAAPAKGDNIRGTVSSVEAGKLVVKDGDSDISIVLDAETKVRKVNETSDFVDGKLEDVTKGLWATVTNVRAGDTITARYIFLARDKDTINAAWTKKHEEDAKAATRPATAPAASATPMEPPAAMAPAAAPTPAPAATTAASQDPSVPAPKLAPATQAATFVKLHEQFVARAKQGNVGVLFLGDSITRGWDKAPEIWKQRYEALNAANFGIGGDRTQHVLWRLDNGELEGISPRVCVLMIGTNNTNGDQAPAISGAIEKIVRTIQAKSPETRVLLLAVFPRTRDSDKAGQMDKIHEINKTIAKLDDGKTIRFLDIGDKFLGPDGKVPKDIMPDGLHPNVAGYQIWADAMQPLLDEMMKS